MATWLSVAAVFAGNALAQDSWGQGGYSAPQTSVDPGQVFSPGMDSIPAGGWSSATSRCSPFFDYRYDASANGQFAGIPAAGSCDGGVCNSPGYCSGSNGIASQRSYGSVSPYYSQRYGSYAPQYGASAEPVGSAPPSGIGIDPRFPAPYAGTLYAPAPANDPGGDPGLNGGSPGGFSSPGYVPGGNLDPNVVASRGDCVLYIPFGSMGYLGGTTPSSGVSELLVPLLQSHTALLYADVRGLYNNQSAYQGSFGSGLRTLLYDSVILGGYGFYDFFESTQRNPFQQASVGVELMTWMWEARSNGYIPTSQGSNSSNGGGNGTAFLQNGLIFINGSQQQALSGVDAEFGMLVAADPTARQELRLFAGGYNFNGQNGGPNIPGVYGRLEARLYDLAFLGQGSRLEFGVISSYDDVNNFQVTGLLNLRISFGSTNCPGGMSLIERRMLDRIVRRQEVVTSTQSTQSTAEAATTTINGTQYNSVVVANSATPNLQALINSTPTQSLIVIDGAAGMVSVPNGITLNPGQALVGGGTPLNVGTTTGHEALLTLPGSTPTIDSPNTSVATITMSSNTSVVGVNVMGGMPTILGQNANNLYLADVNSSNCLCDGMQFISVNGLTISNVKLAGDSLGALFENVQNANITNLTIENMTRSALLFDGGSNFQITGLKVDATASTDDAVKFVNFTNGTFSNWQISNTANNLNALNINMSSGLTFNQISLTNVTGSGMVINSSSLLSLTNSVFANANNDLEFLGTLSQISGSGNVSTGQTSVFTGTTGGGGSIQFTTPNVIAQ